jgi:hypothetical protein
MFKKLLVVVALSFTMVGCASVKMADPALDSQAKQFTGKPGVAGVYIYRNEKIGGAVKMDVAVDGKPVGQTAARTYIYKEVQPGSHTIASKAENTSELTVDAVAGKLYYVWQEVKMGVMYARNKLTLVDEATGQKGVNDCKMVAPQ